MAGSDFQIYFDARAYLAEHGDVISPEINPLHHYQNVGAGEGRAPGVGKIALESHLRFNFKSIGRPVAWFGIGIIDGFVEVIADEGGIEIVLDRPVITKWVRIDLQLAPREPVYLKVEIRYADNSSEIVAFARQAIGKFSTFMRLRSHVTGLRLVAWGGFRFGPQRLTVKPKSIVELAVLSMWRGATRIFRNPTEALGAAGRFYRKIRDNDATAINPGNAVRRSQAQDYVDWICFREKPPASRHRAALSAVTGMTKAPFFCIIWTPCANRADRVLPVLRAFAEQCYHNWNCQIVATAELRTHIEHVIAHMAVANRFRFIDPHNALLTSDATVANSLDWAVICNNEIIPTPEALAEIALAILVNPKLKLVYGDEDRLDSAGKRTEPFFKPDWSPDFFRGRNYLGGFVAVEYKAAVKAERNLATCNFYDLVLKLIESCPSTSFHHIPKILHHIPQHHDIGGTMCAPFALSLQGHYARTYQPGQVIPLRGTPYLRSVFIVPKTQPLVTLIIPMKDRADLSRKCIESILDLSSHTNFEIIVVDNNSSEPDTFAYLNEIDSDPRVRVLKYPGPFNYSAINNFAEVEARGEILGLVNNDIEVISPGWLEELCGHALRPDIGCVGAMLYYPDNRIQHAGIVLGIRGATGHEHRFCARGSGGYFDRLRVVHEVSAVTGACLFVRRKTYRAVGGLDAEAFPVTFNDVDFCLKVRRLGLRNLWTPFAELYHHESVTRGSDLLAENRNRLDNESRRMMQKWAKQLQVDPYYSPNLTLASEDFHVRVDL